MAGVFPLGINARVTSLWSLLVVFLQLESKETQPVYIGRGKGAARFAAVSLCVKEERNDKVCGAKNEGCRPKRFRKKREAGGANKMRKHVLKWGKMVTSPWYQGCLGKQPPSAKNAILRKTPGESENHEGHVKPLLMQKFEHTLPSDKHPSAWSKLTEELAAPRRLINQTLNKVFRVENRAEQPKHSSN